MPPGGNSLLAVPLNIKLGGQGSSIDWFAVCPAGSICRMRLLLSALEHLGWAGGGGYAVAKFDVRIETVELDESGTRQIRARHRTTALLQERRGEIDAAVREACEIVQASATKVDTRDGWGISSLEAKFGLVLAAEAGVILSRASAEASLEIKVTIERQTG